MPRSARLVVPNCAHYVTHCGHNGEPVFVSESDHAYYLENLWELKRKFTCQVYAYCLMPTRAHLLVDPGPDTANLGRLMKALSGRHAHYMHRADERDGTLWEGRFRSSPVSSEYVLACCRYIELNPVRTCLAFGAEDYRWSSYAARFSADGRNLAADPAFLALGADPAERLECYAGYVRSPTCLEELSLIRTAIHTGRPLGDDRFLRELEGKLGRSVSVKPRGRPRAGSKANDPSFAVSGDEYRDEPVLAE